MAITPTLEFAFSVRLDFPPGPRLRLPLAGGGVRGFVSILKGEVTGPKLEGDVVPGSGGDWPLFRADGVAAFDARYMIRARDGGVIYMTNRGYAHAAPNVQRLIDRGEKVDPSAYYFRLAPAFETEPGTHDWLTRSVIVGTGEKQADHSIFNYFVVL
ncbi:DUF3237 family protein [Devosia sp. SL43]|uniref:DUF3237 family protein n=1 Tax=Devosia sp. SL43 TaxID=2806348 RepID=UPI001F3D063D|nr:DUF3237 family protein [Devosia sp. SL43]UJW84981.1 DUF3237 family protein [Devosia sp. SL43]